MPRHHPCDVCGRERSRWQRLCGGCFALLPGDIRSPLIAAHRERRMKEWRRLKRAAILYVTGRAHGANPAATHSAITPQAAYERNAAMLGERP